MSQQEKMQQAGGVQGVAVASQETATSNNSKKPMVYTVDGEEVTLTRDTVRQYLTRGDGRVTDGEVIMFMSLCKANKLNPFVSDCYLIKYGSKPAQFVQSKEAFMKRAETGQNYEGFKAGVIVLRANEAEFLEGAFFLPTDTLVGGWCEVYRSDRSNPIKVCVRMAEYNTEQSTWKAKPATMIRKVAIAQAFREAYPLNLGGVYTPEELDQTNIAPDDQEQPAPNSVEAPIPALEEATKELAAPSPAPAVEAQPAPQEPAKTVHIEATGEVIDKDIFGVDEDMFNPDNVR